MGDCVPGTKTRSFAGKATKQATHREQARCRSSAVKGIFSLSCILLNHTDCVQAWSKFQVSTAKLCSTSQNTESHKSRTGNECNKKHTTNAACGVSCKAATVRGAVAEREGAAQA